MFTSNSEALAVLANKDEDPARREAAAWYLDRHLRSSVRLPVIRQLVQSLRDDDFGVRWAASEILSRAGEDVVPEVLRALTDPDGAGDVRLREAARRILLHTASHGSQAAGRYAALIDALDGPAADLMTMREADRLLHSTRAG